MVKNIKLVSTFFSEFFLLIIEECTKVGDVILVRNGEAPFWTINADVNDLSPEIILPDLFW